MSGGPYREGHGGRPKRPWFVVRLWRAFGDSVVYHARKWGGVLVLGSAGGMLVLLPVGLVHSCSADQEARCQRACEANEAAYLDHTIGGPGGGPSCTCLAPRGDTIIFDSLWVRREPEVGSLSPAREPCPPPVEP